MVEKMETVIVGAGQAGLSLSHFLLQAGREHILLEKAPRVADAWRNRRPDSFTLVTPNWSFQLPGAGYDGPEPEAFMPKAVIVRRFEQYESENHFPIYYSTEVDWIEPREDHSRYLIRAGEKTYESKNLVLATGMFQKLKPPDFSARLPANIVQVTSDSYRNPGTLPPGTVLVVGSGQSGCQITEELHQAGRRVFLSTSGAGRIHRRYRGKDGFDWLNRVGYYDRIPAMLSSSRDRLIVNPHVSGKDGGHDLNLHQFCRDGITLLGHAREYEDGKLLFRPDLKENLTKADNFCSFFMEQVESYISKNNIEAPREEITMLDDGFRAPEILSLDLVKEGIGSIIWATRYSRDFSFVQLPLLDPDGYPSADRGISPQRGLYFLGFSWMNKFKSGLLMGIGESAQYLAEAICKE